MDIFEILSDAIKNLGANKLRSGLTMLGVIIGVASVIAMSSIVEGGKRLSVGMIEKMGTHLLSIRPKELTDEERRTFSGRSRGLRMGDADFVRDGVPYAKAITPVVSRPLLLKYADRSYRGSVDGVGDAYLAIRNYEIERGRFLSKEDGVEYGKVVILGSDVVKKLFVGTYPLGEHIQMGDQRFTVIGTLKEKGAMHGMNFDEAILIPATTAMKYFTGNDMLSMFLIQVDQREHMKKTDEMIRAILLDRHDRVEDFVIRSQDELLRNTELIIFTFRVILGGTAALALLVGGIGIMNVMLISVTERTEEIGLRKAVGASRGAIMVQFLVEAVAISGVGGGMGILLGIFLGHGFGFFAERAISGWNAVILPHSILLGFCFSVGVGVVFGLYPAIKASRMDPAEALRYL